MDAGRILEIVTVLVLSSYFPILTYSFFRYRLTRKQQELELLLDRVNLLKNRPGAVKEHMAREFTSRDYFLPVTFVTFITFVGMVILLASWVIYGLPGAHNPDGYRSVIFSGSAFWETASVYSIEKRNLAVVAFSIMGSFIGASQYIYRRFSTIDLTPGNFFSVGIRMVNAALISLMLAFLSKDVGFSEGNHILAISFLVGLFPERGMRLLLNKVKFFPKEEDEFKNRPVDVVEGISALHKQRLAEVGIDNIQNLAYFNFLILIIKTPFPVQMLLDWTAQAKLVVEFQHEFELLQKAGIRNVLDFLDALQNGTNRLEEIAQITGISRLALEVNHENLRNDQSVQLLVHFKSELETFRVE